jgi:hypothetical protein
MKMKNNRSKKSLFAYMNCQSSNSLREKCRVVNRVGFFLMKQKLNFKSKIILLKKIENIFGKFEIFFCKIIKNILFENKKF